MIKKCAYCGKEYEARRSRRKFCSKECSSDNRKKYHLTKKCAYCGKEYEARKTTKFCSRKCRDNNKKKPITIKCLFCKKGFIIHKNKKTRKFCSPSCAYNFKQKDGLKKTCPICKKSFLIYKNRKRGKFCSSQCQNISRRKRRKIKCLFCKKEFETNGNRRKFCSIQCAYDWRCGENSHLWVGGDRTYGIDWTNSFKEAIRERDNHVCQLCKKHESQLDAKLSVHHVDSVKRNIFKENCVSLCRNCHALMMHNTPYYEIFWKHFLSDKFGYKYIDRKQKKLIEKG